VRDRRGLSEVVWPLCERRVSLLSARPVYRTQSGDVLTEASIARAYAVPESGDITLEDGRTLCLRTFTLHGADGAPKGFFGDPRNYALDDYMYVLDAHWVDGDTLYRGMLEIGGPGGTYRQTLSSASVCLQGLERLR